MKVSCSWDKPPSDISKENWELLSWLYNHPNDIELFPGGLAEEAPKDGTVGATFACILKKQFEKFRYMYCKLPFGPIPCRHFWL